MIKKLEANIDKMKIEHNDYKEKTAKHEEDLKESIKKEQVELEATKEDLKLCQDAAKMTVLEQKLGEKDGSLHQAMKKLNDALSRTKGDLEKMEQPLTPAKAKEGKVKVGVSQLLETKNLECATYKKVQNDTRAPMKDNKEAVKRYRLRDQPKSLEKRFGGAQSKISSLNSQVSRTTTEVEKGRTTIKNLTQQISDYQSKIDQITIARGATAKAIPVGNTNYIKSDSKNVPVNTCKPVKKVQIKSTLSVQELSKHKAMSTGDTKQVEQYKLSVVLKDLNDNGNSQSNLHKRHNTSSPPDPKKDKIGA